MVYHLSLEKMDRRTQYTLGQWQYLDQGWPHDGPPCPAHIHAGGGEEDFPGQPEDRPLQDAVVHSWPRKMGRRETKREGALVWSEVACKVLRLHPRDHVHCRRPEGGPPRPTQTQMGGRDGVYGRTTRWPLQHDAYN